MRNKIIAAVIALSLAFAFGRYTAPVLVKTETKTTQTDNKKSDTEKDTEKHSHKKTTVVEITRPDGTKEKKTTTAEDDDINRKSKNTSSDTSSNTTDVRKEVIKERNKLNLYALAGGKVSFSTPVTPIYGGLVSKEILGPISCGAFGLSNGIAGIALGVSF